MWVQLNDDLVTEDEARISVFDRGFMYGDGVFETMRAYGGVVFGLEAHLGRLEGSAAAIQMALPRSPSVISADIARVLTGNGLGDAVVRIAVSRGRGPRGLGLPRDRSCTYVVTAGPVSDDLERRRSLGIELCVVGVRRVPGACLPSRAKHANYLNSILAHLEATEAGADEALMLSLDGDVAECAGANLFFASSGRLYTPGVEVGILPGIMRAAVVDLARDRGNPVVEARFGIPRLLDADEAFVTNSVVEILPVRRIDGRSYPVPGPETERMSRALAEKIRRETRSASESGPR